MAFLEIHGATKRFGKQTALQGVHASFEKGELTCILGPSGCGKTTLLRIIAGLESLDEGGVFMEGRDCTHLPPARRNFGIVFQSYALFPNMTVEQNILLGLKEQKALSAGERLAKAGQVLEMVDLLPHAKKYPSQLSGGQQQRTALARAIALSPAYLLLDEPLSALDAKVRAKLREEICRIQRELGVTTIMVTHDQEEALTMADNIIVMNNSVIEQVGTPQEIYNRPQTPFVAGFIGTMNFYHTGAQTLAVRPEHIGIHTDTAFLPAGGLRWNVTVKGLEFRGAQTRVHGALPSGGEVCADISSRQAAAMGLRPGQAVFYQIPQDNVIAYPVSEAV